MSKTRKVTGIAGQGNFECYQAMLGKRSSSATMKHADRRDKRARTRNANKSRAIRDSF